MQSIELSIEHVFYFRFEFRSLVESNSNRKIELFRENGAASEFLWIDRQSCIPGILGR